MSNNARTIKTIKQPAQKPEHPLYAVFTQQIGAAVALARQIDADKNGFTLPPFVQKFLSEYGRPKNT